MADGSDDEGDRRMCDHCEENEADPVFYNVVHYRPARGQKGFEVSFCSDECEIAFREGDGHLCFLECDACDICFCLYNPNNRHESQHRYLDDRLLCMPCSCELLLQFGK